MSFIDNHPFIFGLVSKKRHNRAHAISFNGNPLVRLIKKTNRFSVFQGGLSPEIHVFDKDKKTIILFGRIYNPIRINSLERLDETNFQVLFNTSLEKVSGSFIIFKITDYNPNFIFSISTDKYGFRRFLYIDCRDIVYFSTHFIGLKYLLGKRSWLTSYEALVHYYNFGFTPQNQTILKDVKKIPPGSTLFVEDELASIKKYFFLEKYYQPEFYKKQKETKISQQLDNSLEKSVSEKVANRLAGIALSGGIDSAYIARKMINNGINFIGYNLAFKDSYNEFNRIDYIAKTLKIRIKKIVLEPAQIIKNFEYCNSISSEPLSFNNSLSRFISERAKEDCVVDIWDGDGADRLFLGMTKYLKLFRAIKFFDLAKRTEIVCFLKRAFGVLPGRELRKLYILFQNWDSGLIPYPERKMSGLQEYSKTYEETVFRISIKKLMDDIQATCLRKNLWFLYTYFSIEMCPEMFFYDCSEIYDQSCAWPIHAYWDDDIVSLAISLPLEMKIKGRATKYILRKAASKTLDKKYLLLRKIGLQDAYNYISHSKEGSLWRNEQREKVLHSNEYKTLIEVVPARKVDTNKLISLVVWKEKQNII